MAKLIAVHNLDSENLRHAIELGGLACPSLAIIRDDIPFDRFGDITLIAPKDMANPRKHPVFDADVYSVRYPRQLFKVRYGDVEATLEALQEVAHNMGTSCHAGAWQGALEKDGIQGAIKEALYDPVVLVAFARSLGRNPRIPMKDPDLLEGTSKNKEVRKFLKKNPDCINWSHNDPKLLPLGKALIGYFREQAEAIANARCEGVDDRQLLDEEIDHYMKVFTECMVDTEEGMIPPHNLIPRLVMDQSTLEEGKVLDENEIRKRLRSVTDKNRSKFDEFVSNIFTPALGQAYFKISRDGKDPQKKAYTLDNITSYMKRKVRDGENFNYGSGSVRAIGAKQFRNFQDVEDNMARIVSQKDMDVRGRELNDELLSLTDKFKSTYRYQADSFRYVDDITDMVKHYMKKGDSLGDWLFDFTDDQRKAIDTYIENLRSAPTAYFEVKTQRAVELNEFEGALIPRGTDKSLLDKLSSTGLKLELYDPKVEGDRVRALHAFDGVMFGERDLAADKGKELNEVATSPNARTSQHYITNREAFQKQVDRPGADLDDVPSTGGPKSGPGMLTA
ncbi:hypothetical protein [Halioglobus sp. HI00S01]|uniref:hypothetical protein n=1 Tax=Halioglobus sp. HI00S01 TaxID=1822214 RepID=UPI000825AAD8|nr:hypothetical protein [Halioglobus sp. HI00S01]